MKRLVILILTGSFSFVSAYSQNISDITRQEGSRFANKYWNDRVLKCGGFSWWVIRDATHGQPIYELKQGKGSQSVEVVGDYIPPRRLTKADELNRADPQPVEFQGHVYFHVEAGRCFNCAVNRWDNDYKEARIITKKKGRWEIEERHQMISTRMPTCTDNRAGNVEYYADKYLHIGSLEKNPLPVFLDFSSSNTVNALRDDGLILIPNPFPSGFIIGKSRPSISSESSDGVRQEKIIFDPLMIVVEISADGNLFMNGQPQGNVLQKSLLLETLTQIFNNRKAGGVYRANTNELIKTVTLKVPRRISSIIFSKTLQIVRDSGATPINYYVDR